MRLAAGGFKDSTRIAAGSPEAVVRHRASTTARRSRTGLHEVRRDHRASFDDALVAQATAETLTTMLPRTAARLRRSAACDVGSFDSEKLLAGSHPHDRPSRRRGRGHHHRRTCRRLQHPVHRDRPHQRGQRRARAHPHRRRRRGPAFGRELIDAGLRRSRFSQASQGGRPVDSACAFPTLGVRFAALPGCRATSRSRTAPCSSPAMAEGTSQLSRLCCRLPTYVRSIHRGGAARSAPRVDLAAQADGSLACTVRRLRASVWPRSKPDAASSLTAATPARQRACSWACWRRGTCAVEHHRRRVAAAAAPCAASPRRS